MAATKPSSRPSQPRANRKKRQQPAAGKSGLPPVVRRILHFSRPRTARDFLTLLLACLGVATLSAGTFGAIARGQSTWGTGTLTAFLFLASLAARVFPWWRAELADLTADRVRNYAGASILAVVAFSLCWHVLVSSLALGTGYPFPGLLGEAPAALVLLFLLSLIAVIVLTRFPVGRWTARLAGAAVGGVSAARERQTQRTVEVDDLPPLFAEPEVEVPPVEARKPKAASTSPPVPVETGESKSTPSNGPLLPPIDIFVAAPKGPATPPDLELKIQRIEETLASFNVGARVVGHHCGPVVTQFDVQPDRGVKVRRITELQNDLALALAAPTIRIQAPVPGKPVVGIEIPNSSASMVALRDMLESDAYLSIKSPLRVALGKDVAGNTACIDLARMPHLLIAGATGSGKSVCVNGIISCLLYQNTPEQVRLMMVDPKMVELTVYNGVPHLLSPVVTEMDKVVGVLQWALKEMERRYKLFSGATVRNIGRYNEKMAESRLPKLPYIVLIIDELADLMMVAPEDVEDAICRLAQLARAAGIHLVIATQRPSVDVVTGLIKANFPARIAFQMTSQVDSRTILDSVGAEKLLGRGDMLYQPPDAPSRVRLQGAFLSDQEIERLVHFWHESPLQTVVSKISEEEFVAAEKAANEGGDELLAEATRTVREYQHASVSLLQRRLKVGYSRAARLMDQLEERGIVGPADGSKQRPVLRAEDGRADT